MYDYVISRWLHAGGNSLQGLGGGIGFRRYAVNDFRVGVNPGAGARRKES